MNKFFTLIIIIFLIVFGSVFHEDIRDLYDNFFFDPCTHPIKYNIGRLDPGFGLSKQEFLNAIKEAEGLWEEATGKDLFEYSKDGVMSINLVYDERQEGTDLLKNIDVAYRTNKEKYDKKKELYDQYVDDFNILKQQRDSLYVIWDSRYQSYELEVKKWNSRSSAPPADIYQRLNSEKKSLEELMDRIKLLDAQVGNLINAINSLGDELNALGSKVNETANDYNGINHSFEEEFEQGVYISSFKFKEIDIYQFDNHQKLVRVLAHEMGHALGIGHLDNPEDIMHAVNIGKNNKVSKADIAELDSICSRNIINRLFDQR